MLRYPKQPKFLVGDHVRDALTGKRGVVVYLPSDPALRGHTIIVRFESASDGIIVPINSIEHDEPPTSRRRRR
jgi:hypothetical protein